MGKKIKANLSKNQNRDFFSANIEPITYRNLKLN